jgi:predicted nicotinamide N-methyase
MDHAEDELPKSLDDTTLTFLKKPALELAHELISRKYSLLECDVDLKFRCSRPQDHYATNVPLTGLAVWFGAENLATIAAESNARDFRNKTVLELGSGLGLAGISIAKMVQASADLYQGQSIFVLTDGEDDIMPLLQENCNLNGLGAISEGEGGPADPAAVVLSCRKLLWGDGPDFDALCAAYPGGFDTIIGADLIYSEQQQTTTLPALFYTVGRLLKRPVVVEETEAGIAPQGGESSSHGDTEEPLFYLALTRRNFDPTAVLLEASRHGLAFDRVVEGSVYDLFGNTVDEPTFLWRDAIYAFRWRRRGESHITTAEEAEALVSGGESFIYGE